MAAPTVLERLRAVPDQLDAVSRAAPPDGPAPGEWTPADIVRHLIAVELEVWHPRLAQLATQDRPHWAWAEPDRWLDEPGASLDRLLDRYRSARTMTVATLERLDDDGWRQTGTHDTFGVLDVAGLMTKAVEHDDEHVASLQENSAE
jgi:hypothetical protein